MITSKVFLPTANPERAAIIGITSGPLVFPPSAMIGASPYFSSKLALIKVIEFLAAENPNVFAAALHPGMVDTPVLRKFGTDPKDLPVDKGKLFSHYVD
jgi:NAD(P)-dependent dehydrogenase (short-subunit alcohol dehydrogenase family)